MLIQVKCPRCLQLSEADAGLAGQRVRCSGCRTVFVAVPVLLPAEDAAAVRDREAPGFHRPPPAAVLPPAGPAPRAREAPVRRPPRRSVSLWLAVSLPVGAALLALIGLGVVLVLARLEDQAASSRAAAEVAEKARRAEQQARQAAEQARAEAEQARRQEAQARQRQADEARLADQRRQEVEQMQRLIAQQGPPGNVPPGPAPLPPINIPGLGGPGGLLPPGLGPPPGPAAPPGPGVQLVQADTFDMYTDAVISADSRTALLAYPGGKLKHLDCPRFKAKATYRLPGEAYRLALDSKKGVLYAMCTAPGAGGGHFPRDLHGKGDLCLFDVADVLRGRVADGAQLVARQTVPLGVRVAALLLSPDGAWLYLLDVDNERLVRVNTATGRVQGTLDKLDPGTESLCLTPNGRTLYAASHLGKFDYYNFGPYLGTVQKIDAATFKLEKSVRVNTHPLDVQATDADLVFVSCGSGQWSNLTVVDMKTGQQNNQWAGTFNANRLRLSPDQKTIYVSNWMLSPAGVNAFAVPEGVGGQGRQVGSVGLSANFGTRGELRASPDGRFLLCDAGRILVTGR